MQDIFLQFIEICSDRSVCVVPLVVFNKLTRISKRAHAYIQWRLNIHRDRRDKLAIPFGRALTRMCIGHPFQYTGQYMKIIPLELMTAGQLGLRFLLGDPPMVAEEMLRKTRIAFTDISFITCNPVKFYFTLYVWTTPILNIEVHPEDYIPLGKGSFTTMDINGGHVPYSSAHKYIIHMRLPLRYNPITLNEPFPIHESLTAGIAEKIIHDGDSTFIPFDINFALQHFTHVIARFVTCDKAAYDWEKYGLLFNGDMNSCNYTSLIRPLTDVQAEDQQ